MEYVKHEFPSGTAVKRVLRFTAPAGGNRMENPMKKKILKNIIFALLFIIGLSILLYPQVSSKWNAYRAKQLISDYTSAVTQDSDTKEYAEMMKAAQEYNRGLTWEAVPDAFSVRDGIQDDVYDALLNVDGEGLMGSVEIPAINENILIYHYTTEETLQKGAGHLFGSSLPVGGESTHSVLSAHRGLPSAELFTDLPLLEEGDVFYYHILGETLAYEVDQKLTVLPEEVEALAIEEGKDYSTLVTCTPYGVNSHRVLVRGHRIPFVEEEYVAEQHKTVKKDTNRLLMHIVCALIGLALAAVIVWLINRLDSRKNRKATSPQEKNGDEGLISYGEEEKED